VFLTPRRSKNQIYSVNRFHQYRQIERLKQREARSQSGLRFTPEGGRTKKGTLNALLALQNTILLKLDYLGFSFR
jgi:hypothetical protein